MQAADQRAQSGHVSGFDPARDTFDEGLTDGAVLVARQLRSFGIVCVFLIEHVRSLSVEECVQLVRSPSCGSKRLKCKTPSSSMGLPMAKRCGQLPAPDQP